MNWSDERYVRVYTRDTKDLLAVGWEGRLVLYELLRKVDRAGVLDTGGDLEFLAELLRIPAEIFNKGIERLVARQTVTIRDRFLAIPNFVSAQETSQSDRQRQRESRAQRRDRVVRDGASRIVTSEPTSGDIGSRTVTGSHELSQPVTNGHSVPIRAVPIPPTPQGGSRMAQSAGADPEPEEAAGRNGRGEGPPRWSWEREPAPDFVAPDEARQLLAAVTSKLTGGKP